MRNWGAQAFAALVADQNAPLSTVAVVAAVGRGAAIAVDIDAIMSTTVAIASRAAIVVSARVPIAIAGSATSSTSDASATSRGTTGPEARRTTGGKVRRRTTDAGERRRTADTRERRRTADTRERRRAGEWKSECGIRNEYCSAEYRAGRQGQKGLAKHSCLRRSGCGDQHDDLERCRLLYVGRAGLACRRRR
jgi:hypothetical protein